MEGRLYNSEDTVVHLKELKLNKCRYCKNEENRKCKVKPGRSSVNLNKKRSKCKAYVQDEDRVNKALAKRKPIPVAMRPEWYWLNHSERKRFFERTNEQSS